MGGLHARPIFILLPGGKGHLAGSGSDRGSRLRAPHPDEARDVRCGGGALVLAACKQVQTAQRLENANLVEGLVYTTLRPPTWTSTSSTVADIRRVP